MKKSKLLKIPSPKNRVIKNKKEFNVYAQTERIDGQSNLILTIYLNKAKEKEPVAKILLNEKEWLNVLMDEEQQRTTYAKLENIGYLARDKVRGIFSLNNVNITKKSIKEINKFQKRKTYRECNWWLQIESIQRNIQWTKEELKSKRRNERLKERCDSVPEIPNGFEKWAFRITGLPMNVIWYHRHGRKADYLCCNCGNEYTVANKATDSYEGQAERIIPTPKNNSTMKCEYCKEYGILKPFGTYKNGFSKSAEVGLIQKIDDNNVVFRQFNVRSEFRNETSDHINPKYANHEVIEFTRVFFEKGVKKTQQDFNKHSLYTGTDFWDDCNLYGMSNITWLDRVPIYPNSYESIRESHLKYSALDDYRLEGKRVLKYLRAYAMVPQLEFITKLGMTELVEAIIDNPQYNTYIDANEHTAEGTLKIRKNRIKKLAELKGNIEMLRLFQSEYRNNLFFTDSQIELLNKYHITYETISIATMYMTLQKFLNRIEKYAKNSNLAQGYIATFYTDYLSMRSELGYDMTNTVYLFPRDLIAAHDEMVRAVEWTKDKKKKLEANEKYVNIKKNFKRLEKKYKFEKDGLVIRPASCASEIIEEGRILHHCVGGENYLSAHNELRSIILFLRDERSQNTPYYTVELKDGKVNQFYAANDKQPDKEKIKDWLDKWLEAITERILQNAG